MKLSKLLHILSVISGVLGVFAFLGSWSGGMMYYGTMMGYYSQGSMMGGTMGSAAIFFLIAIWLQVATIHHMMVEKTGETI